MEDNKRYLIAALWFICGFPTSRAASYVFGNLTSPLISFFSDEALHVIRTPFMVYTMTDLTIIFLIALLLSLATGKRNMWDLAYIIGVVGRPLYATIRSHIQMYHYNLPVLETLIPSLAVLLIITPLIALLGTTLGKKYQMRKAA
jgi:inner membrane protein involved in colicin E2 resistance